MLKISLDQQYNVDNFYAYSEICSGEDKLLERESEEHKMNSIFHRVSIRKYPDAKGSDGSTVRLQSAAVGVLCRNR